MPPLLPHRALYAAFDRFPSPKGAATHINRMAGTLFDVAGGGLLYVLGDEELPPYTREGPIEVLRYSQPGSNFLSRALGYGHRLGALLAGAPALRLCHFRDPWGGLPVIEHLEHQGQREQRRYATVYEINGLPSIEIPYAYPQVGRGTLDKIRGVERRCWSAADAVITPSAAMRDNLIALGVPGARIQVIPNGADLPLAVPPRPADAPGRYLLYFGALQPWQGVDVLLRAFAGLADLPDLGLVLCSSSRERYAKACRKLAERLGIAGRVRWFFRLSQAELAPWRAHATLSVAPLTECSRNLSQGCCPLKILESMAAGVPVVASDLPSAREIVTDGVHGRLVRPDRPQDLGRAIRVLLEYPERLREMGQQAQRRIAQDFTWARSTALLADLYRRLSPTCSELGKQQSFKEHLT